MVPTTDMFVGRWLKQLVVFVFLFAQTALSAPFECGNALSAPAEFRAYIEQLAEALAKQDAGGEPRWEAVRYRLTPLAQRLLELTHGEQSEETLNVLAAGDASPRSIAALDQLWSATEQELARNGKTLKWRRFWRGLALTTLLTAPAKVIGGKLLIENLLPSDAWIQAIVPHGVGEIALVFTGAAIFAWIEFRVARYFASKAERFDPWFLGVFLQILNYGEVSHMLHALKLAPSSIRTHPFYTEFFSAAKKRERELWIRRIRLHFDAPWYFEDPRNAALE